MEKEAFDVKITENTDSKIIFCVDKGKWLIEISKDGFKFNRQDYPNAMPDDFAKTFVDILEKQFVVTMKRRDDE
jgi:hypothetical protein